MRIGRSYKAVDGISSGENSSVDFENSRIRPKKEPGNCCGWKVASVSLACVAVGLVLTWQFMPTDDLILAYLPQFEPPANPYRGPEAGSEADRNGSGHGPGADSPPPSRTDPRDSNIGKVVPSWMACPDTEELCCNGSASNCRLRLDQMMFGLVHNAMSSEEGDFYVGYNHYFGLERALVAGYRGINLDVCNCDGALQFCHNVCDLGERMPSEVLTNTVQFLNDYPSEVIFLVFQASQDQGGEIVWNDLYTEMTRVEGFVDKIYIHRYGTQWPTMETLVRQDTRIVMMYFNGGTCEDCPSLGLHYFYNYVEETEYRSASLAELQNTERSCNVTRGPQEGARAADFFVVNNFVTPPSAAASRQANAQGFLSKQLTRCASINNKRPNFVYVDFWSEGVTAQLIQYLNADAAKTLAKK